MYQDALLIAEPIAMLFLLASVGLIMRKVGLLGDSMIKGISMILLSVAQPALMIATTQQPRTPEALGGFLTVLWISTIFLCAAQALLYALGKRLGRDVRAVMVSVSVMPNLGFIGIPIVGALYGDTGILYLAGFILGFNFAQWTVGAAMFTGFTLKSLRNLLSPIFLAAVIGALLFIADIRLPGALGSTFKQLSALSTPLSMLILGARLASLRPRQLLDSRLWATALIKLLVLPLILLAILKPLGVHGMTLGTLVLGAAMPSGANGQMLAERFGGDAEFAAKCISLTTLICFVSLPLVLWVVKSV